MKFTFVHARAARSFAENLIVQLELDGCQGIGEGVPRDYVTGETLESACDAFLALDLAEIEERLDLRNLLAAVTSIELLELPTRLRQNGLPGLAASCALELALLDIVGRRFGVSLRKLAGIIGLPPAMLQNAGHRQAISRTLDYTRSLTSLCGTNGTQPRHVKLKVGRGLQDDRARVEEARRFFDPGTVLSVDANMAWTLDQAIEAVRSFAPFEIAWYEEPLSQRGFGEYRALREATGAKVMLDESLCTMEDAITALNARACDLFNIRISKVGGFLRALRLAEFAHRYGLGFQLGAQIGEFGILEAAGRHFVGSILGVVGYDGMPSLMRFDQQLIQERLTIDMDTLTADADLPAGAGLDVTLSSDILAAHSKRCIRWDGRTWST